MFEVMFIFLSAQTVLSSKNFHSLHSVRGHIVWNKSLILCFSCSGIAKEGVIINEIALWNKSVVFSGVRGEKLSSSYPFVGKLSFEIYIFWQQKSVQECIFSFLNKIYWKVIQQFPENLFLKYQKFYVHSNE